MTKMMMTMTMLIVGIHKQQAIVCHESKSAAWMGVINAVGLTSILNRRQHDSS